MIELGQAGLVERHGPAAQHLQAGRVDVPAPDLVAQLGEAGSGDEADPADPDHAYRRTVTHRHLSISSFAPQRDSGQRPCDRRASPWRRAFWSSVFEIQ